MMESTAISAMPAPSGSDFRRAASASGKLAMREKGSRISRCSGRPATAPTGCAGRFSCPPTCAKAIGSSSASSAPTELACAPASTASDAPTWSRSPTRRCSQRRGSSSWPDLRGPAAALTLPRSQGEAREGEGAYSAAHQCRAAIAVRGGLLEGVGRPKQRRLLEGLADQLDSHRQAAFTEPGAYRDSRVAGDVERHRKVRRAEQVPFRHCVDLRRLRRLRCRQYNIEPPHRRLQFGAKLAPPPHRLDVVDAGDKGAEHQPAAQPLAEIAEPGARPFLVGRRTLGDRDQGPAGQPVLQRRQLDLADLGAGITERADRCSDAALRAVADLVIGLVEMVDDADLEVFDAAAELG